jgi:hypothetical protein
MFDDIEQNNNVNKEHIIISGNDAEEIVEYEATDIVRMPSLAGLGQ